MNRAKTHKNIRRRGARRQSTSVAIIRPSANARANSDDDGGGGDPTLYDDIDDRNRDVGYASLRPRGRA